MKIYAPLKEHVLKSDDLHLADDSDTEERLDIVGHISAQSTGKVMEIDSLFVEFRVLLQSNVISFTARYQDVDSGEYIEHALNESDEMLTLETIKELKKDFLFSFSKNTNYDVTVLPGLQQIKNNNH